MNIIYLLLPLALLLGAIFLTLYIIGVRNGQFENLDEESVKFLFEDKLSKNSNEIISVINNKEEME